MTRRDVTASAMPPVESPQVAALREIVGRATAIHSRAEEIVRACADRRQAGSAWLARAGRDVVVTYLLCCRELLGLRLEADMAARREEVIELLCAHRQVVDEMLKVKFGVAGDPGVDSFLPHAGLGSSGSRLRELATQLGAAPAASANPWRRA